MRPAGWTVAAALALAMEPRLGALSGGLAVVGVAGVVRLGRAGRSTQLWAGLALSTAYTLRWMVEVVGHRFGWIAGLAAWIAVTAFVSSFVAAAVFASRCVIGRTQWPWWLVLPPLWSAAEIARAATANGFDWLPLGAAAVDVPTLAPLLPLIGVHGATLGMVALGSGVEAMALRSRVAAVAVAATVTASGFALRTEALDQTTPVRAAFARNADDFHRLRARHDVDVVLAPEGALCDQSVRPLRRYPMGAPALAGVQLGCPRASGRRCVRNSAIALGSDGSVFAFGDKSLLVPLWERDWLGIRADNAVIVRSSSGAPAILPAAHSRVALVICFEILHQARVMEAARQDVAWIYHPSSDLWAGATSAPGYLLRVVQVRAAETGLAVARASTGALSGWASADGRWTPSVDTGAAMAGRAASPFCRSIELVRGAIVVMACLLIGAAAAVQLPSGR